MKTETKYICEVCGTKYDNDRDAIDCEKKHVEVDRVECVLYCGEKYPYYVSIKMKDGTFKNYAKDD